MVTQPTSALRTSWRTIRPRSSQRSVSFSSADPVVAPPAATLAAGADEPRPEAQPTSSGSKPPRENTARSSDRSVSATAPAPTTSPAVPRGGAPESLIAQRDRDHEGHGVSLRPAAEAAYQELWKSEYTSTALSRTLTQLTVSFDRLLSDEKRCDAYVRAIDLAISAGARTFGVLGVGSLLPALHAARSGAGVLVVEPAEPLAQMARACASDNGLTLVVVDSCSTLLARLGAPPDVLLSERVDESLLAEGMLPSLRAAVRAFGGRAPSHGVLPSRAAVSACCVQLGFENVPGFGLDGLNIDLRHFDALRPSGARAQRPPGYWPVRLLPARQPHIRLSAPFAAADLDFNALSRTSEAVRAIIARMPLLLLRTHARICRCCAHKHCCARCSNSSRPHMRPPPSPALATARRGASARSHRARSPLRIRIRNAHRTRPHLRHLYPPPASAPHT
jgi:hypothetical protein